MVDGRQGRSCVLDGIGVAQVGIVDQERAHRTDKIERTRDDDRARAGRGRPPARRSGPRRRGPSRPDPPNAWPAPQRASPAARPGVVHTTVASVIARDVVNARDDPVHVLVGHRCGHQRDRTVRQVRAEVVERGRQGGRPGRVVGPVQEDVASRLPDELEAAGPDGAGVPAPARSRRRRSRSRPPRGRRGSRRRSPRWRPGGDHGDPLAFGRGRAARSRSHPGPSRGAAPARPR